MTQQPQALEVGQVWVPTHDAQDQLPREIIGVYSERVEFGWVSKYGGGFGAACSWTAWRDWQQRHAARVQQPDPWRDAAQAMLGVGKALQRQAEDPDAQP